MRSLRTVGLTLGLAVLVSVAASSANPSRSSGRLPFAERLAAQEAVLRVLAAHAGVASADFETRLPRATVEAKMRRTLAESRALEVLWNTPITQAMLDAEVARMTRDSVMPGRLRERFAALGDDRRLIREIVARPILTGRLIHSFFAWDRRIHGEAWIKAEDLRRRLSEGRIDPRAAAAERTEVEIEAPPAESGVVSSRTGTPGIGTPGPAIEEADRLIVEVPLERRDDRLLVARYGVAKRSWDDWWGENERRFATEEIETPVEAARVTSAGAAADGSAAADRAGGGSALALLDAVTTCVPDTWSVMHGGAPDALSNAAAVWTGSLMLIWGGDQDQRPGWIYDPATDTWAPMSLNGAPPLAARPAAVWTGKKMIVWGGLRTDVGPVGTGGLYDPMTDTWTPTTSVGAPTARYRHTAVWTGTRMIVWGGRIDSTTETDTGALYDPKRDEWTPTAGTGAPEARTDHTAVWTGSEMIVWGGCTGGTLCYGQGARYNPAANSWTPLPIIDAPEGRGRHSAVWTGTQMIVWGGTSWNGARLSTGGRFNPSTGWSATNSTSSPLATEDHTAIWTGARMIVWGGLTASGPTASGGSYDPVTNTWTSPGTGANPPSGRVGHVAVWTGSRMIVWGGSDFNSSALNTGGRYDPNTGNWTPTSLGTQPAYAETPTLLWTGNEILTWGGFAGRYDPATDSWDPVTTPADMIHFNASAVWTGSKMIVYGGLTSACCQCNQNYYVYYDTAKAYDPLTDTWTPIPGAGGSFVPSKRAYHKAVWTGKQMVVWGGTQQTPDCTQRILYQEGTRYDPQTDAWQPLGTGGPVPDWNTYPAVALRTDFGALFWNALMGAYFYHPEGDTWTHAEAFVAPPEEWAEYAGGRFLVMNQQGAGGRYDPISDSWSPTTPVGLDPLCQTGVIASSGTQAFWWGGSAGTNCNGATDHGARYDPIADIGIPTSTVDPPISSRTAIRGVWNGQQVLWWDGTAHLGYAYCMPGSGPCYRDNDHDGYGDPGVSAQCNEPAVAWNTLDCDDSNPTRGGLAGEVGGLAFTSSSDLTWSAPALPAGASFFYDLLRSDRPDDLSAAACLATDITMTAAADADVPAPGAVRYYHVRASTCPGGALEGTLGKGTPGTPGRIGPVCP